MIEETHGQVWVERRPTLGGADVWLIAAGGRNWPEGQLQAWLAAAESAFGARAELASVFIEDGAEALRIISGHVAELIGLPSDGSGCYVPQQVVEEWLATATTKGLVHETLPGRSESPQGAITVGIDAAWLLGGESGAQVYAYELLKALAQHARIGAIVMLSDSGVVPQPLGGIAKITGLRWAEATAGRRPALDIVHRPYQPDIDVDYRRYHSVARCVAMTVLDFIAYDNPSYHGSDWEWRRHQQAFDENVCLADTVLAISDHVGARVIRQFAHQLPGAVHVVPLGTDHLGTESAGDDVAYPGGVWPAIEQGRFLLVLGNDFQHKNRDFAVRVFAEMCDRGYDGRLVLAGSHLDTGSTFHYELDGARMYRDRVVRVGAVSTPAKTWLLRHAQAVLYPTSSEGFGLIPFEAAALGTPTAFVRFGPLRETLPEVEACASWRVGPFADHVFRLLANPATQIVQIRAAAERLTWKRTADRTVEAYLKMLSHDAPWRTQLRQLPSAPQRAGRTLEALAHRTGDAIRRRVSRPSPSAAGDGTA